VNDAALILLAFLVFSPSILGEFLFDDIGVDFYPHRIREHRPEQYKGWLGDLRLWRAADGRPLTWWTFQRNYDFFRFLLRKAGSNNKWIGWAVKGQFFAFHMTNLYIHAANAILAFTLLQHFIPAERALLAAAAFAVHPLQCQSVAYISGRYGVLSAFFALCALNAWALGVWWIIPLCWYLGFAAKEDILAAPFLMGALWASGF
jgi:hypothetical protein